jgi:predicted amidophosphoribosyltransferase
MGPPATVLKRAIEIVLPAQGVGCGRAGSYLCERCLVEAALTGPLNVAVRELRLKYRGLRALAPAMAAPMAGVLPAGTGRCVLVPVPLHPKRLRERGFNQSALLARRIGAIAGLPVDETLLARRTQTGHQAEATNTRERRANVSGAFDADLCGAGLDVILVDDVMTTGGTMDAAAWALIAVGAANVRDSPSPTSREPPRLTARHIRPPSPCCG